MDQHPVPQNITGYQFRLVGSMTLKQFAMLASGIVVAALFYYSPFPGFFKYPFVLLFGLGGIALAFLPIHDMPLDRWVIAFFKAVYSPTQYLWKKEAKVLEFLEFHPSQAAVRNIEPTPQSQPGKVSEYLGSLITEDTGPLDRLERQLITSYSSLLQTTPAAISPPPASTAPPPSPVTATPIPISATPAATDFPSPPIIRGPQTLPTKITPVASNFSKATSSQAKFSSQIPIPRIPETPNVIVGMILTPDAKIIENAIVEVRDSLGHPVRALKTNKLGQFFIGQPLKNGLYEIEVEKEGLSFDIIKFEARGEVILPLEIRSKPLVN